MSIDSKIISIINRTIQGNPSKEKALIRKYCEVVVKGDALGMNTLSSDERFFLADRAEDFRRAYEKLESEHGSIQYFISYFNGLSQFTYRQSGYTNQSNQILLSLPEIVESVLGVRSEEESHQENEHEAFEYSEKIEKMIEYACTQFQPTSSDPLVELMNNFYGKISRQSVTDAILSILEDRNGRFSTMMKDHFEKVTSDKGTLNDMIEKQTKTLVRCINESLLDEEQFSRWKKIDPQIKIFGKMKPSKDEGDDENDFTFTTEQSERIENRSGFTKQDEDDVEGSFSDDDFSNRSLSGILE